jgi:hypothetical protein
MKFNRLAMILSGKKRKLDSKKEQESTLAAFLLKEHRVFLPLLNTIGKKLDEYLYEVWRDYKDADKQNQFYKEIGGIYKAYLFNKKAHFGRLGIPENAPSNSEVYQIARQHLIKGKAIEHILTCFLATLAVFEFLKNADLNTPYLPRFNELGEILYTKELFNRPYRHRLPSKPPLKKDVGILNDNNPHVSFKIQEHTKAIDSIYLDSQSPTFFVQQALANSTPLVAGPSSHCAGLLRIGLLFLDFSDDEELLLQYTNCICAFLVAAGAHSFHEIMSVAKNIGVPYQEGEYLNSLSLAFKNTLSFNKFQEIYFKDSKEEEPWPEEEDSMKGAFFI